MAEPNSQALARRRAVLALILAIATAALWATSFTTHRFVARDAYDYAQIGRQIRQGHGYTTRQTFPRHIPFMEERRLLEGEWPSLLRYPVSPTLNALSQVFFADPIAAAVVQTGVCFLLGVPLFFLLAARLTDIRLATLATVFYVGDPRIWRDGYNGMTESVALLVILSVFYLGFLPGTRQGRQSNWVLLGLLCGFAYLARSQLILLVPLGLAVAARGVRAGARRRSATLFLTSALLAVSPWLARNALVTGDPLFAFTNSRNLLAHTESYSGIDRYLHEPVDIGAVLARYHEEILAKIGRHIWPNVVDPSFWIEVLGVYAAAIPFVGLGIFLGRWWPLDRRSYILFERATLLLLLANFLIVCLIYHRQRYYDTMIPLLTIVLVQRAGWVLGRLRPAAGTRARRAVFVFCVVLACSRLGVTLAEHRSFPGLSDANRRSHEILRGMIAEGSVVMSDRSAEVTLLGGYRTVRLPVYPQEMLQIDAKYLPIDRVLISQEFLTPRYRSFVESEDFRARFELVARLPNDSLLFRRVNPSGRLSPVGGGEA